MKKVKINKEKCLGCGSCTFIYPEMFYLDDDGKANVKEIKKINEEKLQSAVESCPVEAIEIEEKK
ncbi:MAG: ferredoxin [Minisyncoccia bacterium]